ncbi:MAG: glycosyltransferase [Lachnospiraceae bacterium]|nr:glycosyltransferase [Candidatus Colinaster equi]
MKIKFVIIVVCLNSGDKLKETLNSIYEQTYPFTRVIIKDGGSTDDSLKSLKRDGYFDIDGRTDRTTIIGCKDTGIYDAMNQAVHTANDLYGQEECTYVQFLNCGDVFHDKDVLQKVAELIDGKQLASGIYYGNQYNLLTKTTVMSCPKLNEFALYRNVPCHQVCFYDIGLFADRAYITTYRVRADYEHFLYCCYKRNANVHYMDVVVCDYEGGGFSETAENRKKSAAEHRDITGKYMGSKATYYRWIMLLSGAKLRTMIAENPKLSGVYNKLKSSVYRLKR